MAKQDGPLVIEMPEQQIVRIKIVGTSPLLINAFSRRPIDIMMEQQSAPKTDRKRKSARPPRDYDQELCDARHIAFDGWDGIHATGFKHCMVDACRNVGFAMSTMKQAIWVEPEGFDHGTNEPLVRILGSEMEKHVSIVRTKGRDKDPMPRVRPMYREWGAEVSVVFDPLIVTRESVIRLLAIGGFSSGVGDGRSIGFGRFKLAEQEV